MTMADQREVMEMDVVIVGAGPAGLCAAIRLRQLAAAQGRDISVCVVEKGSEVGAHILSGAVLEPRALNELLPDWKSRGAPLNTPVTKDAFYLLGKRTALRLPTPPQMHNHGNYIVSLGNVCRWLATQAEALGVQIFTGFPAADVIVENGRLAGIITGDFGVAKDGSHKPSYQPGIAIKAKVTLLAEGCRGSLSERIIALFGLRDHSDPQSYGIGIKELWEIDPKKHMPGHTLHTVGWPLDVQTYGGSFLYHLENNQVSLGFVTGLDYANPYLDPFMEFQRFKTHPLIRPLLEGGRRVSYGARALNEGGYQSIPQLAFPGGCLIGCAAGFVNVPKIKGSHTAMKSGMLAAEAAFTHLTQNAPLADYEVQLKQSWVYAELYAARNIRPAFHKGLWGGLLYAALDTYVLRGRAPWTLHHTPDYLHLKKAAKYAPIAYPKPDGTLTFDRMSSVYLSNTNHGENQPVHLHLKNPALPVAYNLPLYGEPAQRYCPAGVYEIVGEGNAQKLQINAQNCVHCKTCDIKDPTQNIVWTTPEGGGGPNYPGM
jgi:electron-transferring-flavoprotein dehydrogenase